MAWIIITFVVAFLQPSSKPAATKKRKSAVQNPPSKRPKPDTQSPKQHKSIFNLLER